MKLSMRILRHINAARFWATLVLITFACQAMGLSGHVCMNIDTAAKFSAPCHEGIQLDHTSAQEPSTGSGVDKVCCDDGCFMTSCHSTSVTASSLKLLTFVTPHSSDFFILLNFTSNPINALYRPPTLS